MTEYTKDNPPTLTAKYWYDVLINSDSIWCSFTDGDPFCNPIVHAIRAEKKDGIWFGLDSHNSKFAPYNEKIYVVTNGFNTSFFGTPMPCWKFLQHKENPFK